MASLTPHRAIPRIQENRLALEIEEGEIDLLEILDFEEDPMMTIERRDWGT